MIDDEQLAADAEKQGVGHNSLAELSAVVEEHQTLYRELADLESRAKEKKKKIIELEMETIPDIMTNIGLETVVTSNGEVVTVKDVVEGSVPKKNVTEAAEWLRTHGHGDIIKNEVTVVFTAGQDEPANTFAHELEERGFAPSMNLNINHMTLKAWAREQLEKGVELPLTLLGLFHGRKAKVKIPKERS